ncbi:unnamed protein product [Aureobasidium mustum]|uniref:Uncharacterized protein n=1 Tax=Aureobasidium mustum TaxID=2773714 RepID=A0A9N8P9J1_9PEZI|nr:unnamed protein product [Aureobasidium mustum]
MRPQKDFLKLINAQEGYGDHDGGEHRSEITGFEALTSYNWIHAPLDKVLVQTRWAACTPVSSSKFKSVVPAAAKQPGSPLMWHPPTSSLRLNLSSNVNYRDYEHKLALKHEMDDAVRYMTSLNHRFVSSNIDIFTSDHTLRTLLKFVQGNATPFQIMMQKIGNTLFLVEKSNSAMSVMDLTRSFQDACTSWPDGTKSLSHQRLVQYKFNDIQCLVRFEADGSLDKTDRLMAAALISDLARTDFSTSTQLDSPVLDMNMQASTTADFDSAFSAQPLKRPTTVPNAPAPEVSSTGYHWSQQEAMAECRRKQKELDDAAKALREAEYVAPTSHPHPIGVGEDPVGVGGRTISPDPVEDDERTISLSRPKKIEHETPKKSETSPIVQHERYLEQYPISQFCSITKTDSDVAQRYLDLAGGEFQRALDLYRSQNLPNMVARFALATETTVQEAKQYLKACFDDFEKALRLRATKLRLPNQNVTRIFKREESDREALQEAIKAKNRKGVPHSALFTLHCAAEKSASNKLNLSNDQLLRLWVTRIPGVITAYYDASANVTSITYTDIRSQIREWERKNQPTLTKLSALLKDVKHTARGDRKMILSVEEKYKMEVYKASGTEVDVVSDYQKRLWLERGGEDADEEEVVDDDDDNDDDGDAPGDNGVGEGMDEDDEEVPEGQKVRNYLSDTSSDWEREYDSSDDGDEGDAEDKE